MSIISVSISIKYLCTVRTLVLLASCSVCVCQLKVWRGHLGLLSAGGVGDCVEVNVFQLLTPCIRPVDAGGSPVHTKVQRPGGHQQLRRLRGGGNPRLLNRKVCKGVCRVLGSELTDISGKKRGSLHSSKDLGWSRDHRSSDPRHRPFIPVGWMRLPRSLGADNLSLSHKPAY